MKRIKYIYCRISKIIKNIRNEHIGAFAAQSSFFFIMSFFPLTFLISTILNVSEKGAEKFSDLLCKVIPYSDYNILKTLFINYTLDSTSVISLTTFLTAWSAGKGFFALVEGFHSIISVTEKRNYIFLRLKSLVYSAAFSVIIAILFIIGVFGNSLQKTLLKRYPTYFNYSLLISFLRVFIVIIVLLFILYLLYSFLPDWKTYVEKNNKKPGFKIRLFSSLISTLGIYIYTIAFSLYAHIFLDHNSIYGGISAFLAIMLWLYGSMYILILGFRLCIFLQNVINNKRVCKLTHRN